MNKNQLFVGYRALGFVSNGVPFCVGYYHKKNEPYVVTSIGRAFHVYNVKQLAIISIGDTLPENILCLKADKKFIYAAAGNEIYAFMQLRKVCHFFKGHNSNVHSILPFSDHLISVDVENNIKVWNVNTAEMFLETRFPDFHISCLIHPHFYVNKILFGSREGSLKLFNLKKNNIIYSYEGWASPVTALQQSSAVDIVGVGLQNGRIILLNLKLDEVVIQFQQDWGFISSISFRTDDQPIMVTGSEHGHIAIWNLEEGKLESQINGAHQTAIGGLYCLENQPLLLTNSSDNSLKVWIFDVADGGARLYNIRSGHHKPPTKIRYHGDDGLTILSSGKDSTLRSFSIVHDSFNKSLGVASYNKKKSKKEGVKDLTMPPISDFISEVSRQSDWDGILACHSKETVVTTWNFNRSTMGDHKYLPEISKDVKLAQCVCITSCGNFGLVGYFSGHVHVFNLQSGLSRGSYGNIKAHDGGVIGVHVNSTNAQVISCARDSKIKFWKFKSHSLIFEIDLPYTPSISLLFRDNGNLAVALDDYSIIIVNIETKRIFRRFSHHENSVTDLAFTHDGRWLISSGMDSFVMVFDLSSGILIEKMLMVSPVTSLCMSPTGTYLATTHVDDLGIYIWFNRSLFSSVRTFSPSKVTSELYLPGTQYDNADNDENAVGELGGGEMYSSPAQINGYLNISSLPLSRWKNLLNIDIIKERNKAKEPLRVPKSAPFFLPTISGLNLAFAPLPKEAEKEKKDILKDFTTSKLHIALQKYCEQPDSEYNATLSLMNEMSVALLDLEIHLIQEPQQIINFLTFIHDVMNRKSDFDFISALLNRFLKIHGEEILNSDDEEILNLLIELRKVQDNFNVLGHSLSTISCLLAYNRGSIL